MMTGDPIAPAAISGRQLFDAPAGLLKIFVGLRKTKAHESTALRPVKKRFAGHARHAGFV
ncbi:MAG: hypothetical protein H0V35_14750 [Nitrospira sp.]|nr:hypothetical protein [Nitrospira sp.]